MVVEGLSRCLRSTQLKFTLNVHRDDVSSAVGQLGRWGSCHSRPQKSWQKSWCNYSYKTQHARTETKRNGTSRRCKKKIKKKNSQQVEGVCPAATAATRSTDPPRSSDPPIFRICLNATDPPLTVFPGNLGMGMCMGREFRTPAPMRNSFVMLIIVPLRFVGQPNCNFTEQAPSIFVFSFIFLLLLARRLAKAAILMKTFWPSPALEKKKRDSI